MRPVAKLPQSIQNMSGVFFALRLCRESLFLPCLLCNGASQPHSPIPTLSDVQRSGGLLNPPGPSFPTPPQPRHPHLIWPLGDAAAILSAKNWLRMLIRASDIITKDQNTGMSFSTKMSLDIC